jgi:hypothetical protein
MGYGDNMPVVQKGEASLLSTWKAHGGRGPRVTICFESCYRHTLTVSCWDVSEYVAFELISAIDRIVSHREAEVPYHVLSQNEMLPYHVLSQNEMLPYTKIFRRGRACAMLPPFDFCSSPATEKCCQGYIQQGSTLE